MKFNKKTLAESIESELSGNKHFTSGKKQNVVITEAQLERLVGSNKVVNKNVVTESIDDVIREAYELINQCIISESIDSLDIGDYILNEQGQYNRDPGVAAGEGLENVINSIKKAYEMVKDSDMRKKIENTLVKLNNFMVVTADAIGAGRDQRAPRPTDSLKDPLPYPELEEGEVVEAAKPDFLDLDKDGDKKESMKKAAKDAKKEEVGEEMEENHPPYEEGEDIEEGICENCGEVHEGGCGHHTSVEDADMFDATEGDGDLFDDEEDGFNQDKLQFGGFGFTESKEKSKEELIAEDIKRMKQVIKPISKI